MSRIKLEYECVPQHFPDITWLYFSTVGCKPVATQIIPIRKELFGISISHSFYLSLPMLDLDGVKKKHIAPKLRCFGLRSKVCAKNCRLSAFGIYRLALRVGEVENWK